MEGKAPGLIVEKMSYRLATTICSCDHNHINGC